MRFNLRTTMPGPSIEIRYQVTDPVSDLVVDEGLECERLPMEPDDLEIESGQDAVRKTVAFLAAEVAVPVPGDGSTYTSETPNHIDQVVRLTYRLSGFTQVDLSRVRSGVKAVARSSAVRP